MDGAAEPATAAGAPTAGAAGAAVPAAAGVAAAASPATAAADVTTATAAAKPALSTAVRCTVSAAIILKLTRSAAGRWARWAERRRRQKEPRTLPLPMYRRRPCACAKCCLAECAQAIPDEFKDEEGLGAEGDDIYA
jgi:hypothetical protein